MPIKFKEWTKDLWLSTSGSYIPYDKLEHLILAIILGAVLFYLFRNQPWWVPLAVFSLFAIGWEIRDGIVPYREQFIEGFSWKDLIADYIGYGLVWLGMRFW